MKRAAVLVAAVAVLATVALVPGIAPATHCKDFFILSGADPFAPGVPPAPRPGVNLGSVGCQSEAAHNDTNVVTPGATHLWGGALRTDSEGAPITPTGGSVTMGGTTTTLSGKWFDEPVRGRWETRGIAIPASATTVVMTVTISGGRPSQTVTYTRAA